MHTDTRAIVYLPVIYDGAAASDIGPHITLVYAGEPVVEDDGDLFDLWCDAVEASLPKQPSLAALTGEIERFGDEGVPVALVRAHTADDAADLAGFRDALLAQLAANGCSAKQTWPTFRPHITLEADPVAVEADTVTLGPVTVAVGGETFTFGDVRYAELPSEDRRPTQAMADAAQAVIDLRSTLPKSKRGLTPVGIRRMHQIARRDVLSMDTIRRIARFRDRNKRFKGAERGTGEWLAWGAWGGDTAGAWADRTIAKADLDSARAEVETEAEALYTECGHGLQCPVDHRDPVDLHIGQPFRTTATGYVYDRRTGRTDKLPVTDQNIDDAIAFFRTGEEVPITFEHEQPTTLGRVLAMWKVDDGDRQSLAVLPGYTEAGTKYVAGRGGVLWSSPHLQWGRFFNPRNGSPCGSMRVKAVGLTTSPKQSHTILDEVRLSERSPSDGGSAVDILEALRASGAGEEMLAEASKVLDEMSAEASPTDRLKPVLAMLMDAAKAQPEAEAEQAEVPASVRDRLKKMVDDGEMTVADIAKAVGRDESTVRQILDGDIADPPEDVAKAMEAMLAEGQADDAEHGEGGDEADEQYSEAGPATDEVGQLKAQVGELVARLTAIEQQNAGAAIEREFDAGVTEARWSEGEKAGWLALRNLDDQSAFESTFGNRRPGFTGADARWSETGDTPAPRSAGATQVVNILEHLKEGETTAEGLRRLEADPNTAHLVKGL